MIFSAQQLFSDDQAITATVVSTNVIELGDAETPYGAAAALNQDVGKGTPIPLLIQVTEDFNNLTTLKVAVEVGSSASLGTEILSQTISLADLKAGKRTAFNVVPEGADAKFLGIKYTVAGTAPTAGKVTAGITMGNQTNVTGA